MIRQLWAKPFSKILFLLLATVALLLLYALFFNSTEDPLQPQEKNGANTIEISLKGELLVVELADEESELAKGLSGREDLGGLDGMYFDLKQRRVVTFWMKEMRFPLDIIWIDDEKIVGIEKNAPPPSRESIPSFTSPAPVTHVLEVPAGFTEEKGVKIGDSITKRNTNH